MQLEIVNVYLLLHITNYPNIQMLKTASLLPLVVLWAPQAQEGGFSPGRLTSCEDGAVGRFSWSLYPGCLHPARD